MKIFKIMALNITNQIRLLQKSKLTKLYINFILKILVIQTIVKIKISANFKNKSPLEKNLDGYYLNPSMTQPSSLRTSAT